MKIMLNAGLCLNFEKKGERGYIGGATFCEMAYAFEHHKQVFVLNNLPDDPKICDKLEVLGVSVLGGDTQNLHERVTI